MFTTLDRLPEPGDLVLFVSSRVRDENTVLYVGPHGQEIVLLLDYHREPAPFRDSVLILRADGSLERSTWMPGRLWDTVISFDERDRA